MKTLLRSITELASFFLLKVLLVSFIESKETVVKGANDPILDVKAVQDAVDRGGTVVLKGKFNFGNDGKIVIKKDIKILGEVNDQGGPKTQIIGGRETFLALCLRRRWLLAFQGQKLASKIYILTKRIGLRYI